MCVCVWGEKFLLFWLLALCRQYPVRTADTIGNCGGLVPASYTVCVCLGFRGGARRHFSTMCVCVWVYFRGELARNREYDGDDDYYYYYEMLLGWWCWWWILVGAVCFWRSGCVWEQGGSRHICDHEREHHRREKLLTWDEVPASAAAAGRGWEAHPADTRFSVPSNVDSVRFRLIAPPVKLVQLFFSRFSLAGSNF